MLLMKNTMISTLTKFICYPRNAFEMPHQKRPFKTIYSILDINFIIMLKQLSIRQYFIYVPVAGNKLVSMIA